MKKAEVVLIPLPAMGHKVAVVEIAKLLVQRDDRIYTTVLVMHPTGVFNIVYREYLTRCFYNDSK
jgi:hypothetical protein